MKVYKTEFIRNVALLGHSGDGKTTLAEAMLHNSGATDRFGRVEDGTTVTDYDPEEIKRQISISAAFAPVEWKNHKINVIDVPGYFDFAGEMAGALRVADSAVIVMSAASGLSVGTEKAWDECKLRGIPKLVFINQLDRENVSFIKVIDQLKAKYGTAIAPFQIPIMEGGQLKGIVNAIDMTAREFEGKDDIKEIPIPEGLSDVVDPIRTMLVEAAAETSEELMEKYFEGEELTNEEIHDAIRQGVVDGEIVPILCGSAVNNEGVQLLMDEIIDYMSSPSDRKEPEGKDLDGNVKKVKCNVAEPFSAIVFKTVVDPFIGKLSIFKVLSGELTHSTQLFNANKNKSGKTGTLYSLIGKKQVTVDKITAGDIGALAKLQYTTTGDTLCDKATPIIYEGIKFPEPSIALAISAEKEGEEEKVFAGLNRLTEEDPTFSLELNNEIHQTLISGIGEMQLDVIASKLKNKFGVSAVFDEPTIPYRETIKKPVEAEGKHKKQSGGHGQYGHVFIKFEPIDYTDNPFEFVDQIVGGAVPRQYIPAVEKGLQESLPNGVLAGFPTVGIRATLYDGSYHSVDSSEMAFKVAAHLAYRKLEKANPVLIEPIMHAEVTIPDDFMGDIIGDLNRRRGRILGMTPAGKGLQKVEAEVPQSEMAKYATDLRSMTHARGEFKLTFARYEEVPSNLSEKIIEKRKAELENE